MVSLPFVSPRGPSNPIQTEARQRTGEGNLHTCAPLIGALGRFLPKQAAPAGRGSILRE
jgi:hypothetical protein